MRCKSKLSKGSEHRTCSFIAKRPNVGIEKPSWHKKGLHDITKGRNYIAKAQSQKDPPVWSLLAIL